MSNQLETQNDHQRKQPNASDLSPENTEFEGQEPISTPGKQADRAARNRHILNLQKTVGNRAVQRLVQDSTAEPAAADINGPLGQARDTSSEALPPDLKRKFEGSLSANLDHVRLHTGEPSAKAARAINALAYTEGDHIHFDSGNYRPETRQGEHLLAHEVAHTVQQVPASQAGGGLEITEPDHWSERDASQAAIRMIGAKPATVSPFGGFRGAISRAPLDAKELKSRADDIEKQDKEEQLGSNTIVNGAVLSATNVGDAAGAQAEVQKINDAEPKLMDAISAVWSTEVKSDKLSDNKHAQSVLGEYIADSGIQTTTLGNFQQQYQRLMMDFDRLNVMIVSVNTNANPDQKGGSFAEDLIKTQQITDVDRKRMAGDTTNPDKNANTGLSVKKAEVRDWQEKLSTASQNMGIDEAGMTKASLEFQAKVNDIAAGLPPRSEPQAVADLNALKARLEKIKGYAKTMTGWATKAMGGYLGTAAGGAVEGALGAMDMDLLKGNAKNYGEKAKKGVEDKVPDLANDFVGMIVTLPWAGDLSLAQGKAKAALDDQAYQGTQKMLNELEARKKDIEIAVKQYLKTATDLQHAKVMVRRVMIEIGQVADAAGGGKGHKWQNLAAILGEADAYVAQSVATIAIGHEEQSTAKLTGEKRNQIVLGEGKDEIRWWSAAKEKYISNDNERWVATQHNIHLPTGAKGKSAQGGGDGDWGANSIIDYEMERLEVHRAWITSMRDRLSKEFSGLEVEG